jgi:uncharacterized protein (DUF885 family)
MAFGPGSMPSRIGSAVRDRVSTTRFISFLAVAAVCVCASASETPPQQLKALADHFVGELVAYDPTISYFTGLQTNDHSRFADRSPRALAARDARETAVLQALTAIDASALPVSSRATYAVLKEQLESDLQLRVCRTELWNVNHFDGWQTAFAEVAEQQPVGTAEARAQALKRWGSVPRYLDVEISNLRRGLAQGYAAPKSVVLRVIAQMDGLIAAPPEKSPFYSPAERDGNGEFRTAFAKLIGGKINPAIKRYRDYLRNDYLPHARDGIAVSELPDGKRCYQAFLRFNTTLSRTAQEVYDLGRATVEANKADVIRIGSSLFGTTDYDSIISTSRTRPENHFKSKDELLAYSREVLLRAKTRTATLTDRMPTQEVIIEPEHEFEDTAGVSSHYIPNPDISKPGVYRIELGNWQTEQRGEAELAVVHEAWPGHHLQIALAREIAPDTPVSKLSFNSAYLEGWARYAEALGEEAGIYQTEDAKILRRIWPARGMVVDPGLHAFGWTRQQAIDYLVSSGRFNAKAADDLVDRIAMLPGQLTSYDSGGLEIKALRAEAQAALGARFDLREFNRTVLEEGVVPLAELRIHVNAWISSKSATSR